MHLKMQAQCTSISVVHICEGRSVSTGCHCVPGLPLSDGWLHLAGSTKKAPSAKKRNSGSTKGVGYGGGHSASDEARMTQNAAGEAQKRQDEADAAMTHLLSEIRACLSTVQSCSICLE